MDIRGTLAKNLVGWNCGSHGEFSSKSRNPLPLVFQRNFCLKQLIAKRTVFILLALHFHSYGHHQVPPHSRSPWKPGVETEGPVIWAFRFFDEAGTATLRKRRPPGICRAQGPRRAAA